MVQGRQVWSATVRSPTLTKCAAQLQDRANMQEGFLSKSELGNPTLACRTAWDIPAWQTSTIMPIACLFCLHSAVVLSATCAEGAGQGGRS